MRKSPILVTGDFYFRDFAPNSAPNWMPTTPVSTVSPATKCATRFASTPKKSTAKISLAEPSPYAEREVDSSAKYHAARIVDSLFTQTDISSGGGMQ